MAGFSKIISKMELPKVNEDLIKGIRDEPLVNYVVAAFKTLESRYLKLVDWELITDETQFDPDEINIKHIKDPKSKKFTKRLSMNKSSFDLLRLHFKLRAKDGEMDKVCEILIFKQVKGYMFLLNGKKCYPLYQLVDASTYSTADRVSLKTNLLTLDLQKINKNIEDVNGTMFLAPIFIFNGFKKKIIPLLYYLATIGLNNTIRYFQFEDIIEIHRYKKYDKETQYCFRSLNGFYVKVLKYFFDNDMFTRSFVNMLVELLVECDSIENLESNEFWTGVLGSKFFISKDKDANLEKFIKGKGVIVSFNRLLDTIIRSNLRLDMYNKRDTYAILRWMMREYYVLKEKDNMDLKNKRIRLGEYIASYLIREFSGKMNMFLSESNVTLEMVSNLLNFGQNILIKAVSGAKASLLRYEGSVNDMDLFNRLKITTKGISALGENGSNAVNIKYRGIHPSYVGRLDLNTSGTSDPGLTTNLTTSCKMYGKFFVDEKEPNEYIKNFKKLYANYFNGEKLKVKKLDYFYSKLEKSEKALRRLEDISRFIEDDRFNSFDGYVVIDVTKPKPKLVRIKKSNVDNSFIKTIDTSKGKKKRKKKKDIVEETIPEKKKIKIKVKKKKI